MDLDHQQPPADIQEIYGFGLGDEISSKAPSLTLRIATAEDIHRQVQIGAHVFVVDSLSDPSCDFLKENEHKAISTRFGAIATLNTAASKTVFLLIDTTSADSAAVASSIIKSIQFFPNASEQGDRIDLYIYPSIHTKYVRFCRALAAEIDASLGDDFPLSELRVNLVISSDDDNRGVLERESDYVNISYRVLKSAKRISNLPPNLSTPRCMADWACSLFKDASGTVTVKRILPAEGQFEFSRQLIDASNNAAEILEITYTPEDRPLSHVSLIGKGVTFDAGGLALKPWKSQELMKFDKIGAVICLLATSAAVGLGLPVKITTYVVFCENLLRENSIKPGSVFRIGESGYVEVNNPDGEGRLLLADCLHYLASGTERPDNVITVATLTGDSFEAFGDIYLPYFTNDDRNERLVDLAADESGEKLWRMPLDSAFNKYLSSVLPRVIKNYSNSAAKLITSACFISQFAGAMNWIHFDMAGISVTNGSASGRPLLFLINLLKQIGDAASHI